MATELKLAESNPQPAPVLESPLPPEVLNGLFAAMLKARMVREKLRGAPHGSEAILAGTIQNLAGDDVVVSATHDPVLEAVRGTDLVKVFSRPTKDTGQETADSRVVIAGTDAFAGVATGLALAARRACQDKVVVTFLTGKLARGNSWQQATELAVNHRLPVVLIADWTESRTSSRKHDGRLPHWPFPTITVDGHDVIAVFRVTKEAINAARRGHGPTLVECVNFLFPGGHGRTERDPLLAFQGYLQRHNAWSDLWHSELRSKYQQEIAAAKKAKNNT